MDFDYSYKPKPTFFDGIQFRSRLEAKWAAFFSLAGWQWLYEPLDLGEWSPDFLLIVPDPNEEDREHRLFVEVKPCLDRVQCKAYHHERFDSKLVRKDPVPAVFGVEPRATYWERFRGRKKRAYSIDECSKDAEDLWKAASNIVQWCGEAGRVDPFWSKTYRMLRNIILGLLEKLGPSTTEEIAMIGKETELVKRVLYQMRKDGLIRMSQGEWISRSGVTVFQEYLIKISNEERIISYLKEHRRASVEAIADDLGFQKAQVRKYLWLLREKHLVARNPEGEWVLLADEAVPF